MQKDVLLCIHVTVQMYTLNGLGGESWVIFHTVRDDK